MSRLSTILNDQVFIGNLTAAEDVNMLRYLSLLKILLDIFKALFSTANLILVASYRLGVAATCIKIIYFQH